MSGEKEGPETGLSSASPLGVAGVEPVAAALVLGVASQNERVAAKAEAYLEAQKRLSDLQIARLEAQDKHFHEEAELELSHLRLRRFSGYAKAAFEFSMGLLALALVGAFALMVWNAAHSEGLIVESFGVPPDLAARGLTGQVIAGRLTDKLAELQAETDSNRAPKSYSNDWGDDIKVEIPETGVSIGEAYRFLRRWLGHETHVGGDVWRTQTGLAIAARVNGGGGTTSGSEAELDGLIQKVAQDIYGRTQPYRYAVYLSRHGRADEGSALFRTLAQSRDANERAWANFALSVEGMDARPPMETERSLKLAMRRGIALAFGNLANEEFSLGRLESARSLHQRAYAQMRDGGGDINPDAIAVLTSQYAAVEDSYRGDYQAAAESMKATAGMARNIASPSYALGQAQVLGHDVTTARKTLENPLPSVGASRSPGVAVRLRLEAQMAMALAEEDWAAALAIAQSLPSSLQNYPGQAALIPTVFDPPTAIAEAKMGKFADAGRRVSKTPTDCYPCLLARARIAAMQGQQVQSDAWFARAVASAPSIPIAETQWGVALLGRGSPDAAIEKFKLSNEKGPHFADALEGWGEALMAKNQSHLTLEKFAEAEKYAPNWGRLHLKWGEALAWSGNKEEAAKHFARAAQLDLTPSEKQELARFSHV